MESSAETEFDMRRKHIVLLILMAYIAIFFSSAVLFRESSDKCTIRLDLFEGIFEPGPEGYRDLIQNIVGFIPMGMLAGQLFEKHRLAKALLVGLLRCSDWRGDCCGA